MKNRLAQWFALALTLAVGISLPYLSVEAQAQSSDAPKPMAIVTLAGYAELVKDVDFLGSLVGEDQATQQIKGMAQMFTQGLDKSRPVGVVVLSNGEGFQGAACLPVTNLDGLLGTLAGLGIQVEDQGDGVKKIAGPNGNLFVREQANWAFVAPEQELLEGLPDDPGKFFAPLAKQYDIGARVFMQNIPKQIRQDAVTQLSRGLDSSLEQLPGEDDQDYKLRKTVVNAQLKQLTRIFDEMEELTLGILLDGDEQRALVDFSFTGVQGTPLAEQIAEYSNAKTNYAGFFQPDAAMMMSFASKITKDEIGQFDQMYDALSKQAMKAIDDEADLPSDEARDVMKSAVGDFLDALKETVEAGMMDGGAVLNMTPEALTFVAGGFVGDPTKIESGLKKMAELAKEEPDFPGIKWNSDSHGEIRFHTISVPVPDDGEEPRQLFGDTLDMAIGIGKQSVYFSLGRDCMSAVKRVIDDSQANLGKAIAPMEMTLSLGQIMEVAAAFADGDEKLKLEKIANMLAGEAGGRDHVRMVVQPIPSGLRYRLEAEEGVLQAIGMAAKEAQAKAQMQGAGF